MRTDASVAVVIEVLPPEKEVGIYGHSMDGEAVLVAFPSSLNEGPGNWRDIHPALLASYVDDQDVKLYTYKHTNLEFAENPFTVGDRVVNLSHDDPDEAVVISSGVGPDGGSVSVVYTGQLRDPDLQPDALATYCEENQLKQYTYSTSDLELAN